MIKGGYKIIDFKDIPLTTGGEATTIAGIHDSLEGSYRKPLLLSGLTIDGIKRNDVYAPFTVWGSSFVFTAYGKTITITDADAVTVVNVG